MGRNLTRKILAEHLVEGEMVPGRESALRIDRCLIQDATGTMVWQEFDSFGIPRIKVPRASPDGETHAPHPAAVPGHPFYAPPG